MRTHELKCWPVYFKALQSGEKTFEMRRNDRDYKAGDGLWLNEWNPATERFTDQLPLRFTVTHIMHGPQFGLEPGWCCMSIVPLTPHPDATSKVLLTREQEPRTRTLLRSMLAAFDRGDSDTYWATFGMLLEVHKEVMSADTKGTST